MVYPVTRFVPMDITQIERGSDREFPDGDVVSTSYERQVYGLGAGLRHGNSEWDLELRRQDTGPTGNPPFAMDIDYVETDFARLRFENQAQRYNDGNGLWLQ